MIDGWLSVAPRPSSMRWPQGMDCWRVKSPGCPARPGAGFGSTARTISIFCFFTRSSSSRDGWVDRNGWPCSTILYCVAEGSDRSRVAALRALTARWPAGSSQSLAALITEQRAKIDARKERLAEPDILEYLLWSRSFISIEGLALIAIARAMRMEVDGAFRRPRPSHACPSRNRLSKIRS